MLVVKRVFVFDEPAPPPKASVIDALTSGPSPTALWARVAANKDGTPDPVYDSLNVTVPLRVPPVNGSAVATWPST
jgi:hypothetical protein